MKKSDLDKWIAQYKKSWEQLDTELFLTLFSDDASYQSSPFQMPARGSELRQMWDGLKTRQSGNHIELEVWRLEGDTAIVHWKGSSTIKDMGPRDGDGVFILRFAKGGRCRHLHEWQHWHPAAAPPTKGFSENP
ncbi:MAG: nuclear transport factor 2 family protein [Alphaproteobacteria bacterium]